MPACSLVPSHAKSTGISKGVLVPGKVKAICQRPVGRLRLGRTTAMPPSLKSTVVTFMFAPASELLMITGICTATRTLRRRSLFIKARAARKLDFARSLDTGLYSTKCAPISKTAFRPTIGSTMATATACLLHGAKRALRNTSIAPSSDMSAMIPSKRCRVSFLKAVSELRHKSTSISRSPRTRRRTRTIFSSEHSKSDFRPIGKPFRMNGTGAACPLGRNLKNNAVD